MEHGQTRINMQKLGWKPLEEHRAINKLNILFKAKCGLMDVKVNHLKVNCNGTRRGDRAYAIPHSNVNSHLYSFYPNTIRLWNSLPGATKTCRTVDSFKDALDCLVLRNVYSA